MHRYYDMKDDVEVPGRWFLSDPVDRHGSSLDRVFSDGRPVQVACPVRVQFNEFAKGRGRPVDYSELSIESVPIVHIRVAEVLRELAASDVQILSAQIDGEPDQFCIVNVAREIKCIDDNACEHVERYTAEDGSRRAGLYRDVRGLRIDKTKVGDAKAFRTWGWPPVIIVSEDIKLALERIKTVGVRFEEV